MTLIKEKMKKNLSKWAFFLKILLLGWVFIIKYRYILGKCTF